MYGYVRGRELAGWLLARTGSQSHGDSRWARAFDARLLGRRTSPPRLLPDGIVLGRWGRRVLETPAEDNALIFGVQRSGKTSTVVVPTLLGWGGAVVATSTKEELVRLTGRHRARLGPVWVFAPLDRELGWVSELGLRNAIWNPVAGASEAAAAVELADLFTSDGKSGPSAHWYLSAASLIAGLILAARAEGGDLRSVTTWLNTLGLNQYVGLPNRQRDEVARELLTAFANTPSREAGSIASTARSSLSLWLDNRVARATAAKSAEGVAFEVEDLLTEGGTLYLVAPANEAERCRPLLPCCSSRCWRRPPVVPAARAGCSSLVSCSPSTRWPTSPASPVWVATPRPDPARDSISCSASTIWPSSRAPTAQNRRGRSGTTAERGFCCPGRATSAPSSTFPGRSVMRRVTTSSQAGPRKGAGASPSSASASRWLRRTHSAACGSRSFSSAAPRRPSCTHVAGIRYRPGVRSSMADSTSTGIQKAVGC